MKNDVKYRFIVKYIHPNWDLRFIQKLQYQIIETLIQYRMFETLNNCLIHVKRQFDKTKREKTTYQWKLFSLLLCISSKAYTHLFYVCIADTSYYYWSQGVLYCWVIDLLFILKDKNCGWKQKRFVIIGNFVINVWYFIVLFDMQNNKEL